MAVRDLASPRTLVSANSIISKTSGLVPTSFFNNAIVSRSGRFWRSKVRYAERMERIWLVAKPFLSNPTLLTYYVVTNYTVVCYMAVRKEHPVAAYHRGLSRLRRGVHCREFA